MYLFHLSSVYGIKCLEEIYCYNIFCKYIFNDSTDWQNLWSCGSISPKAVLIFPKNFLDSRSDTIDKQGIINFSSYNSNSYAFLILSDSKVNFLGEGDDAAFRPFIVFYLYFINLVIDLMSRVFSNGPGYPVNSYQGLKKWFLMPPCLTFSIIRYGSRVKWSNPANEVAPSPTPP